MPDSEKRKGNLILFVGSMFSGKSERTRETISRQIYAKKRIVVFKSHKDKRDDHFDKNACITHAGNIIKGVIIIDDPYKIFYHVKDIDIAVIEELHLFIGKLKDKTGEDFDIGDRMVKVTDYLLNRLRISVVANSLLSDYNSDSIGCVEKLFRHSNNLPLTAICPICQRDEAIYSQAIIEEINQSNTQVHLGGENEYEPRCRTCFIFPPEIEKERDRIAQIHKEMLREKHINQSFEEEIKELEENKVYHLDMRKISLTIA